MSSALAALPAMPAALRILRWRMMKKESPRPRLRRPRLMSLVAAWTLLRSALLTAYTSLRLKAIKS